MESLTLRPHWPQIGDVIGPLRDLTKALLPRSERRRAAYELLSLDDRVMRDVGLHRPEARAAIHALETAA